MGRYPKKRGYDRRRQKKKNSNGSMTERLDLKKKLKQYKQKHELKSSILQELNIPNIREMEKNNAMLLEKNKMLLDVIDDIGDELHSLREENNVLKNTNIMDDEYKIIDIDQGNEEKFETLHLLSIV